MSLITKDNKLLVDSSKLTTSTDCCCTDGGCVKYRVIWDQRYNAKWHCESTINGAITPPDCYLYQDIDYHDGCFGAKREKYEWQGGGNASFSGDIGEGRWYDDITGVSGFLYENSYTGTFPNLGALVLKRKLWYAYRENPFGGVTECAKKDTTELWTYLDGMSFDVECQEGPYCDGVTFGTTSSGSVSPPIITGITLTYNTYAVTMASNDEGETDGVAAYWTGGGPSRVDVYGHCIGTKDILGTTVTSYGTGEYYVYFGTCTAPPVPLYFSPTVTMTIAGKTGITRA